MCAAATHRPGVGHAQHARARVLEDEVLIWHGKRFNTSCTVASLASRARTSELGAVDGLAAGAVASREVAALAHELLDHAVEGGALEVQGLAALAHALLACEW